MRIPLRSSRRPILAFCSAAVAVSAAACGGGHDQPGRTASQPIAVHTIAAQSGPLAGSFEAGGIVQARLSATVTSRIMAPVREVRVSPGDRVRAGQILVRLDDRDLAAQARQASAAVRAAEQAAVAARAEGEGASASLALAEATHARISRLHGRKSATAQELDETTASLRAAQARIATVEARTTQAESSLASVQAASEAAAVAASYATVTAPFDGVVTEKLIDPGNMAVPGSPLVRLEGGEGLRVDVRLDERRAAFIHPGDMVEVLLDDRAPGDPSTATGTVSEVARAVDADTRAFLVKVAVDQAPNLRSGMFARVRFKGSTRAGLSVPASAVIKRGQVATVFVVERDVARLRLVQTGERLDDRVEIVAGLDKGDAVVVSPPPALTDGQRVQASGRTPVASRGAAGQEATR